MKCWASSVELLGALVTAYGLFAAYGRASGLPDQVRAVWARIRGVRPDMTAHIGGIASGEAFGTADVYVKFALDDAKSVQWQLRQLADYVCELRSMFGPLNADIATLDRAVDDVHAHAETVAARALAEAKADMRAFGQRLDQLQAVDLRVAVVGVLISAIGIVLGYWA